MVQDMYIYIAGDARVSPDYSVGTHASAVVRTLPHEVRYILGIAN
jgi:hypothetical protein